MASMSFEQLMTVLYVLIGWCTVTTVVLLLARRDVKLGLLKWWMIKRKKQPLKLRYYGADLNVHERIVATAGRGDSISIDDNKGLFGSDNVGSTFFIDEKAIRRCDDGINEINISYKSVMPIVPDMTVDELEVVNAGFVQKLTDMQKKTEESAPQASAVEIDKLVQHTDPKRLNRLIEYITLAAKASALAESENVLKFARYAFFASLATVGIGALIWYTLDADIVPKLQALQSAVSGIGSSVLNV